MTTTSCTPENKFGKRCFRSLAIILAVSLSLCLSGCSFFGYFAKSSYVGEGAAKTAKRYIGTPYVYGGKSPQGFDCSGLTSYVYKRHGVSLPRTSSNQAKVGRLIRKPQLKPGDLVFFKTGPTSKVSHVGIYIGQGKFIHAPGQGKKVTVTTLKNVYFQKAYHSARRMSFLGG